jgi:hypothetical protein
MSSPFLPRSPAFASLEAPNRAFSSLEVDLAERINALLGRPVLAWSMAAPTVGIIGFYRIRDTSPMAGHERDRFLKVLPIAAADHALRAEEVASWLASCGVTVQLAIAVRRTSTVVALEYPFFAYRLGHCIPADGALVGETLADANRAFATFPQAEEVQTVGLDRLAQLGRLLDDARERDCWPGPEPCRVRELADKFSAPFEPKTDARMIHGDVNIHNILITPDGSQALLIDFEDSLVTWLPPRFDVAMALQRLVLVAEVERKAMVDCGRELLRAYNTRAETQVYSCGEALRDDIQWLSLRSLFLLAAVEESGSPTDEGEWRKFLHLAEQAEASTPVLRAIVANS